MADEPFTNTFAQRFAHADLVIGDEDDVALAHLRRPM